jgi:hypothetical protein
MDGRTQLPVIEFLKAKYGVGYVDAVTEPGPVRILAEQNNSPQADSIISRVDISVNKHKSVAVAIIAHCDCAGNPADEPEQKQQLALAIRFLKEKYPHLPVVGLWLDSSFDIAEF